MSRNRTFDKGFSAHVRVSVPTDCSEAIAKRIAAKFDAPLRCARSIKNFVLRAEAVAARREVLVSIAALRHESTDRADSAIMPILRRAEPHIEKRAWTKLPADSMRGLSMAAAIYADYSIISEQDAAARIDALRTPGGTGFVSSTDVPPAL